MKSPASDSSFLVICGRTSPEPRYLWVYERAVSSSTVVSLFAYLSRWNGGKALHMSCAAISRQPGLLRREQGVTALLWVVVPLSLVGGCC